MSRCNSPLVILSVSFAIVALGCGGLGNKAKGPPPPPGDMTLLAYTLQKPPGITAIQADVKLATYYNYAYAGCADTHYSFELIGASPYARAYAFCPKQSGYGKTLYEQLKNGESRLVTVQLHRIGPDGDPLPAKDDNCFALAGVVSPSGP